VTQFHRSYGTKEEYNYRLSIFEKNFNDYIYHNANNAATHGYTKGINGFADMSDYEFK